MKNPKKTDEPIIRVKLGSSRPIQVRWEVVDDCEAERDLLDAFEMIFPDELGGEKIRV
jgi:hypothetical protein